MKTKTAKPTQARVKELIIIRLEALTEKQWGRILSRRRRPLTGTQARHLADLEAHSLASGRSKSPARQITDLTRQFCLLSLLTKRRSLRAAGPLAWALWKMGESVKGEGAGTQDFRIDAGAYDVEKTEQAIRSLARAEALLTRLVWRGAEAQARREQNADVKKNADVSQ